MYKKIVENWFTKSYSSLLTKPVPFGSKSLKAASMVSSGSVPAENQKFIHRLYIYIIENFF